MYVFQDSVLIAKKMLSCLNIDLSNEIITFDHHDFDGFIIYYMCN